MFNILSLPAVSIGSFTVAVADLVGLAVLIVFVIIGMVKGFAKQVLALFGLVAALIVSILFSKYVAKFIIEKIPVVQETILGWFGDKTAENIPSFMQGFVENIMLESEVTLPELFTNWTILAISFILTFLIAFLLFIIIKAIISKIVKSNPELHSIDVFLGGLLGVVKAFLVLVAICFVLGLFGVSIDCVDNNGEPVKCVLNDVLTWVMNQKVVSDIFESIFSFITTVAEQVKNAL